MECTPGNSLLCLAGDFGVQGRADTSLVRGVGSGKAAAWCEGLQGAVNRLTCDCMAINLHPQCSYGTRDLLSLLLHSSMLRVCRTCPTFLAIPR